MSDEEIKEKARELIDRLDTGKSAPNDEVTARLVQEISTYVLTREDNVN